MIETYDKDIPRRKDFDDDGDYEVAMEGWSLNTRRDVPVSEEVYEAIRDYYDYAHITSKVFTIGDMEYRVEVLLLDDGESPDEMNTRILLVAHEGTT